MIIRQGRNAKYYGVMATYRPSKCFALWVGMPFFIFRILRWNRSECVPKCFGIAIEAVRYFGQPSVSDPSGEFVSGREITLRVGEKPYRLYHSAVRA